MGCEIVRKSDDSGRKAWVYAFLNKKTKGNRELEIGYLQIVFVKNSDGNTLHRRKAKG